MKRPIIILLAFYISGILAYEFIIFNLNFILICMLSLFIFYTIIGKNSIIYMATFIIAIFISGMIEPHYLEKELVVEGTIYQVEKTEYNTNYFIRSRKINDKVSIDKFIFSSEVEMFQGNKIKLEGIPVQVYSQANYRVFNYRSYLKSKGVFYEIDNPKIQILDSNISLKSRVVDLISQTLETNLSLQASSFLKSMILGLENELDIVEDYRNLGLAHILAISGLHINLLIKFLDIIGKKLRIEKRIYSIFIIIFLLVYGYIVSFPVSLIRALLMYCLGVLAVYSLNVRDTINNMLFTIFIILIINPFYIYSLSFYLSFAAVFSIFYVGKNLKNIFTNLSDFLILPLAIQIGTFPFLIYYFNQVNLISPLANLIIIPILSFALLFGFVYVIIPFDFLAMIINFIFLVADYILNGMLNISNHLLLILPSISIFGIILYYFILFIIFNYRMILLKTLKYKKFIVLPFLIILILSKPFVDKVQVNIIDVSQGDGALIRYNGQNILIDTGGLPLSLESSGKRIVEYLRKNGVNKIDKIFISHDDLDHMGNLYEISKSIRANEVIGNNIRDFNSVTMLKGEKISLGNDVYLQAIMDGGGDSTSNDASLVLFFSAFDYNILFTGDIEEADKNIQLSVPIDFLKVAHHGAKNSTSQVFLDQNKISKAVISVGKNNYGHPNPDLLKRLVDHGIETFRTDLLGNISITIRPYGYFVDYYYKKYDIFELLKKIIFYWYYFLVFINWLIKKSLLWSWNWNVTIVHYN